MTTNLSGPLKRLRILKDNDGTGCYSNNSEHGVSIFDHRDRNSPGRPLENPLKVRTTNATTGIAPGEPDDRDMIVAPQMP